MLNPFRWLLEKIDNWTLKELGVPQKTPSSRGFSQLPAKNTPKKAAKSSKP